MESKTELLATQSESTMDAEKTKQNNSTSYELIKVRHIQGTPFTIVKVEENQSWFIAMGNARLTEYKDTVKECEEMIENKSWELTMAMCGRIAELTYNQNLSGSDSSTRGPNWTDRWCICCSARSTAE